MIVLHAVVPADSTEGVARRLQRHEAGPIAVLYEETAGSPSPDRAAVLEHGRRIVRLADAVPLLPMRYGTTVHDLDELRAVSAERAEAWSRRLSGLVGRRELVVHATVRRNAGTVAESGRDYLRQRMTIIQQQDRALEEARALVDRWADETRVLPDRERLAVLVREGDIDAVRHVLDAWGRAHDDVLVTVTGPWPPFSFCEDGEPA
jgi:hypothetical protein